MTRERLCNIDELPVGQKRAFRLANEMVVLYHLDDGFYATERLCTHTLAPLERGKIVDGHVIQCPLHRARFDIRTGEVKRWANFPPGIQALNVARGEKPLRVFPTSVEDGAVYVDV